MTTTTCPTCGHTTRRRSVVRQNMTHDQVLAALAEAGQRRRANAKLRSVAAAAAAQEAFEDVVALDAKGRELGLAVELMVKASGLGRSQYFNFHRGQTSTGAPVVAQ